MIGPAIKIKLFDFFLQYAGCLSDQSKQWLCNVNEIFLKSFLDAASAFEVAHEISKGKPFFFDSVDMRTLHFDDRFIQSAMRISAPEELLLSYTRSMMAFLLFNHQPKTLLMIGLGGGSLAKYCHRILPATKITVLEVNADVIALRDAFSIPHDSDRFSIFYRDAAEYVATISQQFDVILHDGFDADGLAPTLNTINFYIACKNALREKGVLVCNLWLDGEDLVPAMNRLWSVFDSAVWWSNVKISSNRAVFAIKGEQNLNDENFYKKALELDRIHHLGFHQVIDNIETGWRKSFAEFSTISSKVILKSRR